MEQQSIDTIDFQLNPGDVAQASVSERDDFPSRHALAKAEPAPVPVPERDLVRTALLGLAGGVTLVWMAFLAWGALRLIAMLFFS
jgi:hypothetical protein